MKDSQLLNRRVNMNHKYIKANNERFSTRRITKAAGL